MRAATFRSGLFAGIVEVPDNDIPSVSTMSATEDAVPIVLQDPSPQLRQLSNSRHSFSEIFPDRKSAHMRHKSVPVPTLLPLYTGAGLAPAVNIIAGKLALAAPISAPGTLLSQFAISTTPSIGYERKYSSISIDNKFRYNIAEGFIMSSPRLMTGKTTGNPPASVMPAFISSI